MEILPCVRCGLSERAGLMRRKIRTLVMVFALLAGPTIVFCGSTYFGAPAWASFLLAILAGPIVGTFVSILAALVVAGCVYLVMPKGPT